MSSHRRPWSAVLPLALGACSALYGVDGARDGGANLDGPVAGPDGGADAPADATPVALCAPALQILHVGP